MIAFHKSGSLRRDIKQLKGLLIRRLAAHSAQYCTEYIQTRSPAPETSSVNMYQHSVQQWLVLGIFQVKFMIAGLFLYTLLQVKMNFFKQLCTIFNIFFFHRTSIVVPGCQIFFISFYVMSQPREGWEAYTPPPSIFSAKLSKSA